MTMRPAALKLAVALFLVSTCVASPGFAQYTVTGKFLYEDREFDINGFTGNNPARPIRFADVQVMANGVPLASGATDARGEYAITVPGSVKQPVSAVCIARAPAGSGLLLSVRVADDNFGFGDYYSVASDPLDSPGTGIVQLGTTLASSGNDTGKAFNIWDVIVDGIEFLASAEAAGSRPATELTMIWRQTQNRSGSYYESSSPKHIYVGARAAYDDTVISHELGHFFDDLYSRSDNPGGQHFIGDDKQDIRLSWGEGLATFLGSSMRRFKGYPRPDIYLSTDGENLSFSYEIESLTGNVTIASKKGSTNEVAVTAALWDVIDGAATRDDTPGMDDDPLERPFREVWNDLATYFPTVNTPGPSIEDFWNGWFAPAVSNGFLSEMQTVFASVNGIEFVPDPQESDNSAAGAALAGVGHIPALESGVKVLISEIDLGRLDAVELYNAGSEEADLSGWTVRALAKGYDPAVFEIPSFRLAPGAFVVLSETSGVNSPTTLYFETNVSWANDEEGSCALVDGTGRTRDFVRWGRSKDVPPDGRDFPGVNPASPPAGKTLARPITLPATDSASDWRAQNPSLGTYNFGAGELHHTFYPVADVDYVGFNTTAGTEYLIETVNLANGGAVVVDVLSGDGAEVLASTDASNAATGARIQWTAPSSGRHFLRARRHTTWNYAKFGSFDVRIAAREPITVAKSGGARYSSVAEAVTAARSGDTIEIRDSGTYRETVSITGKNLTIRAVAGQSPVLDGSAADNLPALSLAAETARVEGLRIRGGSPVVHVASGTATLINTSVYRSTGGAGSAYGLRATGPGSTVNLVNCVVALNGGAGLGVYDRASARVANSILSGNAGGDVAVDSTAGTVVVKNSVVETGTFAAQNGNIQGNPGFSDPAGDDFHLQPGSAAIDRADPRAEDAPVRDGDGIPRNVDGDVDGSPVPDIGAYEYLPASLLASAAVFPQIAIGGAYESSIIAINPTAAESPAQVHLADSSGGPISASTFSRPGTTITLPLPGLGSARLRSGSRDNTLTGYARLLTTSPGGGGVLFRKITGDRVSSEAGVGASKAARSFRIYVDNTGDAFSGYAVANPGTIPANVRLTLRRSDGSAFGAPRSLTLAARQHIAEFVFQRFAADLKDFEGSLEFDADQPLWAVALRYDNPEQDAFSTIPVLADEAATELYFPQIADGGGYRSTFILMNPSASTAQARIEFFSHSGEPLGISVGGVLKTRHEVSIPRDGVFTFATGGASASAVTGWVRVTSGVPIGGSSIFQVVSGGRIVSQAGVAASPAVPRFTSYVESLGYTESGLAICNPAAGATRLALRLRNAAGEIVASASILVPPLGHVAKFFTEWFPDSFPEFQGTLEVESGVPVAGVALRYDNYLADVFATIPVVTIP